MLLEVGVKALIQNKEGAYLFLQRANPLPDGSGIRWDIPGGRIDTSETLEAALAREIHEETGLELATAPKLIQARDIFVSDKNRHIVRLTYIVQANGEVRLSHEHNDFKWLALAETQKLNVDDYLRGLLAELITTPSEPHVTL